MLIGNESLGVTQSAFVITTCFFDSTQYAK